MYELISAISHLGSSQVIVATLSALRAKLIAVLLGPSGLGIFAQAKNFQLIAQALVTLDLEEGMINLIASNQSNPKKQKSIVLSIGILFAILGSLILLLCWIFRLSLSAWVFGTNRYGELIVIVGISAFFFAQHQLILSTFQAFLKWKIYSTVKIMGYVIGISISILLIFFLGIKGAVLSLVVTQLTGIILGLIYIKMYNPDIDIVFEKITPDWLVINSLIKYIGPLLGEGIMLYFCDLYIRRSVITQLGTSQSGIFHVVVSISDSYFWLVLQPVLGYCLPKVSSILKDKNAIVDVQNHGIRISLLSLFPIILLVYGLREAWIPILYSDEFLEAGNILLWWIIGDIFRTLRVLLDIDLIPLGQLKYIFFQTVLYCGGLIVVTVPFILSLGLKVVPIGYLIINVSIFSVTLFYHKRITKFHLSKDNITLMSRAFILLVLGFWCSTIYDLNVIRLTIMVFILLMMYFWLLKKTEMEFAKLFVVNKITSFLKKI